MPTLIVSAKPDRGRYRCGIHFTREQSIVEVDEAQETAIREDKCLVVHEDKAAHVTAPESADAEADAKPARGRGR